MPLSDFKQPFEVIDFSGGITDNVFMQDPRRARELDNFLIKSDRTPDSRPGSVIDDLDNPQIPAGVQRIGAMINYNNNDTLLIQSAKKIYFRDPSAYATLQGPTSNDVFSDGTVASAIAFSQWNGHLFVTNDAFCRPMKIYKDSMGDMQVRSSGLPALATDPVITPGAAGANDYIYSFIHEYTYDVNGTTFQDFGPVIEILVTGSDDPGTTPNAISAIPVLANGATDNWDATNVRIFIYRTVAGGQDNFLLGSVSNGTTIFNDNFADSLIVDNDRLYIDDGTLDFDPPPACKFIHVINNTGYYGFLKEGSEEKPYIVRQSIPGDIDSVPIAFDIRVEDIVKGVSSAQSVPIILCNKHIYRVEGFFDNFGRGVPVPIRISDTAGCVSHLSIVQAEGGIFWFGNDGVYFSDGYRTMKVSDGNNERYKALIESITQTNRIYGRFDDKERRIYWALQKDTASLDNDSFAVLELRYGISPDMPFTTCSGESFRPSSIEFFNSQLYRADSRGYVFVHDTSYTTDPKVDTTADPNDWNKETIIWNYESININFGSTQMRKYVTKMLLTAANRDNTSIQINAVNDDGRLERELKLIRWRRNFRWRDDEFYWGSSDCVWDAVGIIEQWRRMPAKGLRLSYLKIQITNGFSVILTSDGIGNATFNRAAKTITLDSFATQDWPIDSVDYVVKTEVDSYAKEYPVSLRSDDTLTVLDPSGTLPQGSYKWELWGYKKGEPLNLLSYNLFWDYLGQNQMTFESGQDGTNA